MSYTLIALFVLTGDAYIEREGLDVYTCPGRLALARRDYLEVKDKLHPGVGEIRFLCLPEHDARAVTRKRLTSQPLTGDSQ
jgi:hypothetical protein